MQLESPAADMDVTDVEEMFISLFSSLSKAEISSARDEAAATVHLLEGKWSKNFEQRLLTLPLHSLILRYILQKN